jgi:hypothetical protein
MASIPLTSSKLWISGKVGQGWDLELSSRRPWIGLGHLDQGEGTDLGLCVCVCHGEVGNVVGWMETSSKKSLEVKSADLLIEMELWPLEL